IVQLILFIVDSECTKHMTGNLKLLCNFVEKVYYVEGLIHNLFLVGQFCDADLEVAFWKSTCFVRDLLGNDLLTGNRGSDIYTISIQESTSSTPLCLLAKATPTQAWLWHRRLSHLNFDYINLLSKKDIVIGLPKLKYVKDQLCLSCELSKAKRSSFKSKVVPSSKGRLNLYRMDLYADVPSQQELDLLFCPLYDEFFNAGSNPSTNIQSTSASSTHTNVHAEENNNNQAEEGEQLQDNEFTNPFCAPIQEEAESPSHNIGNSNVPTFNQPQISEYRWTKDQPLEQVRGNPSRPVQTRRHLAIDPEMYMYALTMSTVEPKNIKEVMADSAWIQAMQEELHQFDRLQEEGIDFKESFALVAHLEAVWICIAYAAHKSVALQNKKTEFEKYNAFNDRTIDYDKLEHSSSVDAHVPSKQELDLLFGPLYDELFNACSNPQDKQPLTSIQPTSAPSTPTNVHAKENNDDQAEEDHLPDDEFTNPFCAPAHKVVESSSHNIEQFCRNPSRPVQTRRQLAIDPKMCMFALNVSTAELKNINEAMADSAWIKAMQEELYQFDRL
nr:integrase, catalytic region, zinc finger, CCHC-type, peptidase aspartic, catalytic [Tanacetum cinerariifolium]